MVIIKLCMHVCVCCGMLLTVADGVTEHGSNYNSPRTGRGNGGIIQTCLKCQTTPESMCGMKAFKEMIHVYKMLKIWGSMIKIKGKIW